MLLTARRPGYIWRVTPPDELIDLGDRRLRARRLVPRQDDGLDRTTLVFLHEGLGCIEMWRDFPQTLCDATMCAGVVYDRCKVACPDHGWSIDLTTGTVEAPEPA